MMRAVVIDGFGDADRLKIDSLPIPVPGAYDLLVRVKAAGLNRADILQRRGLYPPPPGDSTIPGLELAGVVVEAGPAVTRFQSGDRVFGLVGGGAHADFCLIHEELAMPIPETWDFSYAAAIAEVFFTANETLFELGRLSHGETVLIHAGGSGVGTAGIQMAVEAGARVFVTAGSAEKIEKCQALGAHFGIHYKERDFLAEIQRETHGRGVDLIQDFIGASYLDRNLKALAEGGRLVLVGLMGGARAELDLSLVLTRRLQIFGSVMRSLDIAKKVEIRKRFEARWWLALLAQRIQPVIYAHLPIERCREAQRLMEKSANFGKIVLTF